LRRECELAADEDVLVSGTLPSTYAEHLLGVARALTLHPGSIGMAARPSELARRISVLLSRDQVPEQLTRSRCALICASALMSFAFVACVETSGSAPAASPPLAPARAEDSKTQALVEREATRVRSEWQATRVAIVVLRPDTGELLGFHDDAQARPITPASTLKPLTVALALDAERITPKQRFDCQTRAYGDGQLRDAASYGWLDSTEILAVSSNVGVSRIFDALGSAGFRDGLQRFGLAVPAQVASGSLSGATAAIGHRVRTTPLALARAYAVLANDGVAARGVPNRDADERLLNQATARTLREMLESAVSGERATGKAARIAGVRVAGKTGTSDAERALSSFVGWLPADAPRFVIYVGVESPRREASGGTCAAPVFAKLGRELLAE
jgi:cell division protein FtsI/penicillin-binding protein 2